MQKPAIHIYSSISARMYEGILALVPGVCVAILIVKFPPMVFMFGLPVLLLIYIGLRVIWTCFAKTIPLVVLDSNGLHISRAINPIPWTSILGSKGSTVIGKIPYRILNIHLKEEVPSSVIKPGKLVSTIGKALGFQSTVYIQIRSLAIRENDLISLIEDYKSDPATICDDRIIKMTDKDMPMGHKTFNWIMSIFLLAFLIYFVAK